MIYHRYMWLNCSYSIDTSYNTVHRPMPHLPHFSHSINTFFNTLHVPSTHLPDCSHTIDSFTTLLTLYRHISQHCLHLARQRAFHRHLCPHYCQSFDTFGNTNHTPTAHLTIQHIFTNCSRTIDTFDNTADTSSTYWATLLNLHQQNSHSIDSFGNTAVIPSTRVWQH